MSRTNRYNGLAPGDPVLLNAGDKTDGPVWAEVVMVALRPGDDPGTVRAASYTVVYWVDGQRVEDDVYPHEVSAPEDDG